MKEVKIKPEQRFWLHDGGVIGSLKELTKALKTMTDATYSYHVNKNKNDFAAWVKGVFKDKELAASIANSKSKKEARDVILLKFEVKKIEKPKVVAKKKVVKKPVKIEKKVLKPKKVTKPKKITVKKLIEEKVEVKKEEPVVEKKEGSLPVKEVVKPIHESPKQDIKPVQHRLHYHRGIVDFLMGVLVGAVVAIIIMRFMG